MHSWPVIQFPNFKICLLQSQNQFYDDIFDKIDDFKGIIPDTDVQPKLIGSFVTAFSSGLWAYDGWNNLNYLKEENSNPRFSIFSNFIEFYLKILNPD